MNRREFLAGSLTLVGLGLSGCRHSGVVRPKPLSGERRDPSFAEGHKLRTPEELPKEPETTEVCDGIILGGGISGLAAGWRWTRAGFADYKLLELEPELGGNSRALVYPPTPAPIAAHYLPLPNTEARAVRRLLKEMGVLTTSGIDSRWVCHDLQERLFYDGSWHPSLAPLDRLSESARKQMEHFQASIKQWAARRDKSGRKVFALPLHYSSREPEFLALDRLSFGDYAREQGWTDPFMTWYLNYACRDDFGGTVENCSAWAGLHYFASRDGGGLGGSDDILVWPEGNHRLVDFMKKEQAGQVRPGSLVLEVSNDADGVRVDYLEIATGRRKRIRSKVAVCCLPAFVRSHVGLLDLDFSNFVYAPWVTANLYLEKTPSDLDKPGFLAWDNVIYDSDSLGYVVATHQMLSTDPNRETVWTWYRPFADGDPKAVRETLLKSSWEDWSQTVLDELQVYHPDIREFCRRVDVTVLGHGMVRPSVDFVWSQALEAARAAQGRIFFGHGDLSGLSLFEESQFRGVEAAESALKSIGLKSESFL